MAAVERVRFDMPAGRRYTVNRCPVMDFRGISTAPSAARNLREAIMKQFIIVVLALAGIAAVLFVASSSRGAGSAPASGCAPGNLGIIDAKVDKPTVPRGDNVTMTASVCYEPPGFTLWAQVREAPSVQLPMFFNRDKHAWAYTYQITQEIPPAEYHVDFIVKDRAGRSVATWPPEKAVTINVTWPEEQVKKLESWRREKQITITNQTKRMDTFFTILPRFPVVGVWFDAQNYHRSHIDTAEAASPWNPYLRKTYEEEIDYISKTLGLNMIVLSGASPEENAYARKAFPNFVSSTPQPGDYAVYDEPDYRNVPIEEVVAWAESMHTKGIKTMVVFSGHKADDLWTDYVFRFLDRYTPDIVAVDCYPVFYDFVNLDFFKERINAVGVAARKHKAQFYVVMQGFGQLGKWAFPIGFYWKEMIEASSAARADGVMFFLWTSGVDDRSFTVGIDMMPQEYHRILRAIVDRPIVADATGTLIAPGETLIKITATGTEVISTTPATGTIPETTIEPVPDDEM
jgi:hypothetical protein